MAGNNQALSLTKLVEAFASLPGIGMKSAQRLAYYILKQPDSQVEAFAQALLEAKKNIKRCTCCQNLTDRELCPICDDPGRDKSTICVVEDPKDVTAFERTKEYRGVYHVLHGLIDPINGVGPDQLCIKELIARLRDDSVKEVILATNPTAEGEATAMYLKKLIKPLGVKVSRLAFGIPIGSSLEYADEMTLFKALENRAEL